MVAGVAVGGTAGLAALAALLLLLLRWRRRGGASRALKPINAVSGGTEGVEPTPKQVQMMEDGESAAPTVVA